MTGEEEGKRVLKKKIELSPVELDSIIFAVPGSTTSISALIEAAKNGVDVVIMDNWRPVARLVPAQYGSFLRLWHSQFRAYLNKERRIRIARALAAAKLSNQENNLRYLSKLIPREKYDLRNTADGINKVIARLNESNDVDEVMNLEAEAARLYWRGIRLLVPRQLGFKTRLKRFNLPPGSSIDPFNSALNIGYGLLRKEAWRAIFAVGLNPYIGFIHRPRPGRMSLVFDLMEEFRPLIDREMLMIARKNPTIMIGLDKGEEKSIEAILRTALASINQHRQDIFKQARRFADHLINGTEYKGFKLSH